MIEYGKNKIGANATIFDPVTLGFPSRDNIGKKDFNGVVIGDDAIIRSGTIIYCEVRIGAGFQSGHNVVIREKTVIGDRVTLGTGTIIEGNTSIGEGTSLQSMVYVPTNTTLGRDVFIGPNTVLTNDRYPPTGIGGLAGPTILDRAAIGANVTILPGVCIGKGALVAAGSVVTHDIPDGMLAIGSPARIKDLPKNMTESVGNRV
jgi:acetyltransferase-like isoleucine patch superfamily enzyme